VPRHGSLEYEKHPPHDFLSLCFQNHNIHQLCLLRGLFFQEPSSKLWMGNVDVVRLQFLKHHQDGYMTVVCVRIEGLMMLYSSNLKVSTKEWSFQKDHAWTPCSFFWLQQQTHARAGQGCSEWSERQPWACINTHCLSLCFVFYTSLHFYHLLPK